ncbi:opioid growth factor receptor-like [Hydra vulgaris]|uniref:opioid growth factor receptor-like n=1 Tax=Hydra vulgaris TaxID=6087 RepID=UPI0001923D0E|nr:opioid growth factor receptor-like [Hydra vulgaris]
MLFIQILLMFCFLFQTEQYAIEKNSVNNSYINLHSEVAPTLSPAVAVFGKKICDCDIHEKCYVKLCNQKNEVDSNLKYKTTLDDLKRLFTSELHSLKIEMDLKLTIDKPKKREQLPPDARGDQSPTDARGDQLPPDARGDQSPPDARGDQLPPDARGDQSPPDARGDQSPPDARGDQSPPDARGDQSPPDARGDQSPPDARGDQLPPDARGDQSPPDARGDQLPPDARGDYKTNKIRENILEKRIQWLLSL